MKSNLSDKPKNISTKRTSDFPSQNVTAWFYEESGGFYIVVEISTPTEMARYIHITISWRTILASVSRYIGKSIKREKVTK